MSNEEKPDWRGAYKTKPTWWDAYQEHLRLRTTTCYPKECTDGCEHKKK